MEAPKYFSYYGAYVPVAAAVVASQQPNLANGLPAPWSTLTQSSTNPFSNFNATVQAPATPAVTATGESWIEMSLLTGTAPPAVNPPQVVPKPQPVIEKVQEQLRRCSNCGGYYKNPEETCRYHPGLFRAVFQSQRYGGGGTVWSCCKSSNRASPGCKQTKHSEDKDASRKLNEYGRLVNSLMPPSAQQHAEEFQPSSPTQQSSSVNLHSQAPSQGLLIDLDFGPASSAPAAQPSSEQSKPPSIYPQLATNVPQQQQDASATAGGAVVKVTARQLKGAPPGCIKHFVKPTDTTIGICMQYGVTKQQLQEVNKGLSNDNLYAFYELNVPQKSAPVVVAESTPQDEEEERLRKQKQAFVRFKQTERVNDEEARYYLQLFDYDYEQAVQERRADVEFEKRMQNGSAPPRAEKWEPRRSSSSSKKKSSSSGVFDWF